MLALLGALATAARNAGTNASEYFAELTMWYAARDEPVRVNRAAHGIWQPRA